MMVNRMILRRVMIAALMIVAVIPLCSQNVVVESRLDSVEMYVGSQAMLTVETTVDSGAELVFPDYRDTVVAGLEVIDRLKPDTVTLNEGKRMTVRHGYMVAAFDSAFFHIPGLKVMVDGREYESNDLVLRVYHFPIDNADPDMLRGIKDIADVPFVVTDWLPMAAYLLLLVLFAVAVLFLFMRYRDNKPIIRIVHVEPQPLPHERAGHIIDNIRARDLQHSSDAKQYYTALTEALRVYIAGRFGFNAMEMTSSEIVDKLMETNDRESLKHLQSLFTVADLVKFAKYVPMLDENDANLLSAVAFINKTKQEVPEAEREKPHDVVIEEPRSKRQKRILLAVIILAAAACIAFVMLSAMEIKEMLF